MGRSAYFDCFAGVSGDMILGAMVDAGLSIEDLRSELGLLDLAGYELASEKTQRRGIAATALTVRLNDPEAEPQRSLADVRAIVDGSSLRVEEKTAVMSVFATLAAAEGRVHGQSADAVHFHDVGAIDAIVDIAGAVVGLRLLGVDAVYASALPLGSGAVQTSHGRLPVPAPATLALIEQSGAPIGADPAPSCGEVSTPTGVAILTTLATFARPLLKVERVGYGAGGRDPESHPNALRLWLGEPDSALSTRQMLVIETNIDDMPAEQLSYALERLLAAGAVDAWFTPIQMKKGRPAVMLSALCGEQLEEAISAVILRETTTLGLRVRSVRRHEAEREVIRFESSLGQVGVKIKRLAGLAPQFAPEFEDCRTIALERDLPLPEVYRVVAAEAAQKLT